MGFLSPVGGLGMIVVERCGDPGPLLMVQIPACVSHSGDCSLNVKAAQLPDCRKAVIQFELSAVENNVQRLCA